MEVYPLTDQGYGADEQLAQLFTPNTILPSQFFRGPPRCAGLQGEQRLLLAVLEDAIHVYCKESATSGRRNSWLFREAEEWIESGDQRSRLVRGAHATRHAAELRRASGGVGPCPDERLDTDGVRNGTAIGDRRAAS